MAQLKDLYISTATGATGKNPGLSFRPDFGWTIGDSGFGQIDGYAQALVGGGTEKRIMFSGADKLVYGTDPSGATGWVKLFNGVIIQWGYKISSTTYVSTLFATSFPTACTYVGITLNRGATGTRTGDGSGYVRGAPTTTGFTAITDSPYDFYWFAVGY